MTEINLDDLVDLAGYKTAKAQLMKSVINCAIETLIYAEKELDKNWSDFCSKAGALLTPLKKIPLRPNENAMTYELADYIDDYLKQLPISHHYRGIIKFCYEKPKRSEKLAGSKRKRLDFRFEANLPEGPELVIEAKPLFLPKDIDLKYYGSDGLGRFLRTDEPYTLDSLGGLLGYVRVDQARSWQLNIKTRAASSTGYASTKNINVGKPYLVSYSTEHSRDKGAPIWMLHMLLTFPNKAAI